MNKKQNRILDAVSAIDDDIIEETGYRRYLLFRAWRQRMRKRNWFIGISSAAASILLLVIGIMLIMQNLTPGTGGGTQPNVPPVGDPKQVPVYQGMTVSNEMPAIESAEAPFESLVLSNSKHVYGNQKVDKDKPFGDNKKPIKDAISDSLQVIGSADGYFAKPNDDIYITVHINNPDAFEILSFTLNGVKYSDYMFEAGSDLENLILKVNVGDVEGDISYTIDAIKYVDGTEIKDVRMEGDDTVSVTVQPKTLPAASVSGETVGFNGISFAVNVTDPKALIKATEGDKLLAILYDGETLLAQKELNLGDNTVEFTGLTTNALYQYAIVAVYDALDGEGRMAHVLYENALYTKAVVLFENVKLVGDTFSFSFRWDETVANKTLTSLALYMGDEKVQDLEIDATSVSGLLPENDYTLVATYLNGENTETLTVGFSTKTTNAITLVSNGGNDLGTVNLSVNDPLPTPTREGYTFGGWYSDVDLTQKVDAALNDDITLYAWWREETRPSKLVYENRPQEGIYVTGISELTLTEVWVPGYIGGLRVEWVEGDFTGITHLTLSTKVRIENHATLQSVTFAKGTGEIELWVVNCPNIERVTLSADTHMLGFLFIIGGCPKLKPAGFHVDPESRYRVVNNCLILDDTLVLGCQDSVIPADGSVKYISPYAFSYQDDLTSVVIPEGIEFKGSGTFSQCINLTSVTLPESLTEIPKSTFSGCRSLTAITIPSGVSKLGVRAFAASGLRSIVIPDNVKEIDYACFEGCDSLTDVSLPDGLRISEGIFFGCPISYESEGGVLYLGNYAMGYDETSSQYSYIVIREGTTAIAIGAFQLFLESIQLPSTLTVMPSFGGHRYLRRVILPEGIESIPYGMFSGCSNLVEVNIPTSVKSIERNAFQGCTALLTDVEGGVSYLGKWAISCDATLTSVTLRADTVGIASNCFKTSAITSIELPDGLRYISHEAFASCAELTELTIPASVECISGNPVAFSHNVTRITVEDGNTAYHVANGFLIETATKTVLWGLDPRELPTDDSVTAIKGAFVGMSSRLPEITELVLPDSIVRLETESFYGADALEQITLSGDLEYIGTDAFGSCRSLTDIYFSGTMAEWEAVEKINGWFSSYNHPEITIHCTDGDIVIEASN